MLINYWDCKYAEAEERNFGTDEEPDYEWRYYCNHPKRKSDTCKIDNKADCKLLNDNK